MARRHHPVLFHATHAARAALLTLACATTGAFAQSAPATAAPQAQEYRIAPGPLDDTLARFAIQAGISLNMPQPLVQGRSSPGLQGRFVVQDGLALLLVGTGLEAEVRTSGVYVLRAVAEVRSAAPPALGEVRVTAEAERSGITEGTGSYITRSMGTATGLNLSVRETPQSVTVVTRQQMEDQGLTEIAGVLERTTGITRNQNESDRTYLAARGFDITKVQYDGLPSRDYFDYDSDVLSDTAIYDRIEIVRGATGLLNGTGEPSAALNFVRKRPTAEFQGHAQLSAGSWNAYRSEVDVSGALAADGKIRGRIVAAQSDRKSNLDHYRRQASVLYGVLEADLPSDMLLTLGLDYQSGDTRGVTYGSPVPVFYRDGSRTDFPRSTSTATDWTSLDRQRLAGFVSLEKTLANQWRAKLDYAYRTSEASPKLLYLSGYPDRSTGSGVNAFATSYDIDQRAHALNLQMSGPFTWMGREHGLTAGLAYYQRKLDYQWHPLLGAATLGSFYDRASYAEPHFGNGYNRSRDQDSQEKSAYLTSRWNLADPLRLIAGARWTSADYEQVFGSSVTTSRYGGEITPYLGLVYDLSPQYSVYASYTDIFETQTNRDRNGALLPAKKGTNYEAGIKGELMRGRLQLAASVFRVKQDNLAEFDATVEGESRYKAIRGATVRGYELEASGEFLRGWNVAAGFTHRTARSAAGVELRTMEPQNLLRLTSAHKLSGAWRDVSVGGHLTWQSRIYEKGIGPRGEDAVQSQYTLLHLFASYQANKDLSLHLAINNLFDKVYYTSIISGYGRYGDPRNVTVSMKYRF